MSKFSEMWAKKQRDEEIAQFGKVLSDEERKAIEEQENAQREQEFDGGIEETRRLEREREARQVLSSRQSSIPPRYKPVLSGDIWAKSIFNTLKGIDTDAIIFGENGVGKTYLAWALVNEAWKMNKSAKYTTAFELISDINSSYSKGTTDQVIAKYTQPSFLVIDELDKFNFSQNGYVNMFHIISRRYDYLKPTLIITNAEAIDLPGLLGKSIMSRLRKTTIRMEGRDNRG